MSGIGSSSNSIGSFIIGVSPIGSISPFDVRATVISQYANSPTMLALIDDFFQAADPTPLIDSFYQNVWDILTAVGYGLDVWGRIVGVSRTLQVTTGRYFGFETVDGSFDPWNVSPFYTGVNFTSNFNLSDDAYRQLILAKAYANITDCAIPSLNKLLQTLFGASGKAYVTDDGGMAMSYTFDFAPTPVQYAIITQSNVLPRPTGVVLTINTL